MALSRLFNETSPLPPKPPNDAWLAYLHRLLPYFGPLFPWSRYDATTAARHMDSVLPLEKEVRTNPKFLLGELYEHSRVGVDNQTKDAARKRYDDISGCADFEFCNKRNLSAWLSPDCEHKIIVLTSDLGMGRTTFLHHFFNFEIFREAAPTTLSPFYIDGTEFGVGTPEEIAARVDEAIREFVGFIDDGGPVQGEDVDRYAKAHSCTVVYVLDNIDVLLRDQQCAILAHPRRLCRDSKALKVVVSLRSYTYKDLGINPTEDHATLMLFPPNIEKVLTKRLAMAERALVEMKNIAPSKLDVTYEDACRSFEYIKSVLLRPSTLKLLAHSSADNMRLALQRSIGLFAAPIPQDNGETGGGGIVQAVVERNALSLFQPGYITAFINLFDNRDRLDPCNNFVRIHVLRLASTYGRCEPIDFVELVETLVSLGHTRTSIQLAVRRLILGGILSQDFIRPSPSMNVNEIPHLYSTSACSYYCDELISEFDYLQWAGLYAHLPDVYGLKNEEGALASIDESLWRAAAVVHHTAYMERKHSLGAAEKRININWEEVASRLMCEMNGYIPDADINSNKALLLLSEIKEGRIPLVRSRESVEVTLPHELS